MASQRRRAPREATTRLGECDGRRGSEIRRLAFERRRSGSKSKRRSDEEEAGAEVDTQGRWRR